MRREIRRRRTIILIAAVLAMACATGVYASVPKGVAQINLMTEEGENVTGTLEIYVGTETQLTCKVLPEIFMDREVRYVIADDQVATVDENGLLKALDEGETLLTVECAGARQNYTVKVETAVEDITGLDKEITLYEGDEFQLKPKIKMAEKDLKKPEITYKVKRNTIAKVEKNGLVTALKEGETTITVKAGDVTKKVKVIVEAMPVETYTPVVVTTDNNNGNSKKAAKKPSKRKTGGKTGGKTDSNGGSNTGGGDSSGGESGDNSGGGSGGSGDGGSGGGSGESGSGGGSGSSTGGESSDSTEE